jgi:hypothetical protein
MERTASHVTSLLKIIISVVVAVHHENRESLGLATKRIGLADKKKKKRLCFVDENLHVTESVITL